MKVSAMFGRNQTIRFPPGNLRLIIPFVLLLIFPHFGSAQEQPPDTILLKLSTGSQISIRAEILDYNGEEITFRTSRDSDPKSRPASEVVSVETPQSRAHVEGLILLTQYKLAAASQKLEEAFRLETRNWVQREILSLMVRTDLKRGEFSTAISHFLKLYQAEPRTQHFPLIPLRWSNEALPATLKKQAAVWMQTNSEVPRLIGASLVLKDLTQGPEAVRVLRSLLLSSDDRVRTLAKAQLWRDELGTRMISPQELRDWQKHVETMPAKLRGGPYYLLGQAYLSRQEYQQAATALLWLPLVYDTDDELAARACLEAGDAMMKSGLNAEAERLYREVTTRFQHSEAAQIAQDVLTQLSKSP